MGRSRCSDDDGGRKGYWTPEEDQKLFQYIQSHVHGSWRPLSSLYSSIYLPIYLSI
ncbi:hypothetical protein MUK42_10059 [Musa troglodytarum]|uniref:Myb-like domain-containing protein n=1 Tax=Musa troglodytarum TaxID=320322 RepID=A0A9E7JDE6_9LILI|nr:hypothetical protein MUK42_10059 [Musa troglodytarum]